MPQELSGFFLPADKFQQQVDSLNDASCNVRHVRLFHNEPHHTIQLLQALQSNGSITHLEIYALEQHGGQALTSYLASTSHLKSLCIQQFQDAWSVQAVADGLSVNRSVTEIQLEGLDDHHLSTILSAAISHQPMPHTLLLSKCTVGPASATALARAAPALCKLNLSNTTLTDTAVHVFWAACSAQAQVTAHTAGTTHSMAAAGQLHALSHSAPGSGTHVSLTGGSNSTSTSSGTWFMSQLVELNLANNSLTHASAPALAGLLSAAIRLSHLDLSGNPGFGDEGAVALAAGLAMNAKLAAPPGAAGGAADAGSSTCGGLQRLDLSGCGIGPAGCSALAGQWLHALLLRTDVDAI